MHISPECVLHYILDACSAWVKRSVNDATGLFSVNETPSMKLRSFATFGHKRAAQWEQYEAAPLNEELKKGVSVADPAKLFGLCSLLDTRRPVRLR